MKGLLIATVLLAALGGLVWWSNRTKTDEPADGTGAAAAVKILTLTPGEISKVEIRHRDVETTRIEREGADNWKLTSPEALRTDREAVSGLVSAVASVTADKVAEEKAVDLAQFGLLQPAVEVVATIKGGKTRSLKLGDDAPVGGGTFAQVDGDARVFVLGAGTKANLSKLGVDLRDKRILTFDGEKLARIELAGSGPAAEFSKNAQGEWAMIRPSPMRADSWQVEELLRKLKELKLDPLLTTDQKADLQKQFNAGTAVAAVSVTDGAGVQKLEVRKSKENKYYARSSAVDGFHLLTEENGKGFEKTAADFRSKKLFDFGFNDPRKVEYKDDSRQVSYRKSGEKWLASLKPMDAVGVQSLIDRLRELSATGFPASGFTTPAIEVAVTAKTTERVSIAKAGEKYIARREGEAALYELDAKVVEELRKAAADVKEEPKAAKK